MIIIILLLFVIALPVLLNIVAAALGLSWLYNFISTYGKYIVLSCILLAIVLILLYLNNNKEKIKWNYFKNKSEKLCTKIIKKQFDNNPTITSRQLFDEIVKHWVPLASKLYPNSKPKDLGIKLEITPTGIEKRINSSILKRD